jgi:TonB-linked SusC/RagA family outer membrane protein
MLVTLLMAFAASALAQQSLSIRGKVTDEKGQGLPGVSVLLKGTTAGTATGPEGDYTLTVPDGNGTLVFSFIGYVSEEVPVENRTTIAVSLIPDIKALGEIVVVGYGTQKKESVTAAVASVEAKELTQSPAPNVSQILTGRVAGVTSIQDQGAPGNDQNRIYVRGVATTGNVDPLYVIDGVPRTAGDFNRLAPNEIASVSVLKDAAAAAVFGARGANGVVLITTRRGTAGRTSFSYSFNYGLQKATRLPDYVDAYGYADLYNKALENEGRPLLYSPDDLQKYRDGSDPDLHPNTDWFSIVRGTAPMQQHNLAVDGGTDKTNYFLSLSYLDQKSLFHDENSSLGFKRYNFRSNIDVKATPTTRVALDVSGYLGTRTEPGTGYGFVFENINRPAPVYAAKYANGLYGPGYSTRNGWAAVTESGYQRYSNNGLLSRLQLVQDLPFIPGLSLKGVAAFDYKPNGQKNWSLPMKIYNAVADGSDIRYDQVGGFANPSLYQLASTEKNLLLEAHALYSRSLGKHDVGGLLLYSRQRVDYEDLSASRNEFLSSQLDIINSGGTLNQQTTGNATQYRRQSLVGRASYAYAQRYLLEFSFRYDGSTLFAAGQRFGFFPAVSAGWVLSEENFMKKASFLDYLKLRGSYGSLGNDQISQYQYLTFYGYGGGVPMGETGAYQSNIFLNRLANASVTWETSRKTNVGLEATLLKNFVLEADYFWEKRDGILGQRGATIPATLGLSTSQLPFENFQQVENRGYELVVGYRKQLGNGLGIQTRFSLTHARNQVVDIGEPADKPERIRQAGRPLNALYGYQAAGLFQSEEDITAAYGTNHPDVKPGDIRYQDLNGDQKIDGNDITYIGSANLPVNILGWNATVDFKGFELSLFWQAGTGNQQYFNNWFAKPFNQAGNALERHTDYWRADNPDARYPRILTSSAWNYDNVSSFWLYDMRYLRLKNAQLAYNLPQPVSARLRAQAVRFYVSGINLLTFSAFREVDPENTNGNGHYYPQQTLYNAGAQITF